jgi:hypothetical protein
MKKLLRTYVIGLILFLFLIPSVSFAKGFFGFLRPKILNHGENGSIAQANQEHERQSEIARAEASYDTETKKNLDELKNNPPKPWENLETDLRPKITKGRKIDMRQPESELCR